MKKTKHGGKRIPGPGKKIGPPFKGDKPRVLLTARVDPKTLEIIEKERGDLSQGAYLDKRLGPLKISLNAGLADPNTPIIHENPISLPFKFIRKNSTWLSRSSSINPPAWTLLKS